MVLMTIGLQLSEWVDGCRDLNIEQAMWQYLLTMTQAETEKQLSYFSSELNPPSMKSSTVLCGFDNGNIRFITAQLQLNCIGEHLFLTPERDKEFDRPPDLLNFVCFFSCRRGILYTFGLMVILNICCRRMRKNTQYDRVRFWGCYYLDSFVTVALSSTLRSICFVMPLFFLLNVSLPVYESFPVSN